MRGTTPELRNHLNKPHEVPVERRERLRGNPVLVVLRAANCPTGEPAQKLGATLEEEGLRAAAANLQGGGDMTPRNYLPPVAL